MAKFIISKNDMYYVHLVEPETIFNPEDEPTFIGLTTDSKYILPFSQDIIVKDYQTALDLVCTEPYCYYRFRSFTKCRNLKERK